MSAPLLTARPAGSQPLHYVVSSDDGPLAELNVDALDAGGTVRLDGTTYRIERDEQARTWQLWKDDQVVFEARKPAMVEGRFELNVKGAWLELGPKGRGRSRFTLVGPDWSDLGEIRRPGWLSRRFEIALSDLVPLEARLFLLFCAIVLWKRGDRA